MVFSFSSFELDEYVILCFQLGEQGTRWMCMLREVASMQNLSNVAAGIELRLPPSPPPPPLNETILEIAQSTMPSIYDAV